MVNGKFLSRVEFPCHMGNMVSRCIFTIDLLLRAVM